MLCCSVMCIQLPSGYNALAIYREVILMIRREYTPEEPVPQPQGLCPMLLN